MLIIALVKSWRVCTTESDEPSAEAWVRSVVSEAGQVGAQRIELGVVGELVRSWRVSMPRLVLLMAKLLPAASLVWTSIEEVPFSLKFSRSVSPFSRLTPL